MLSKMRQNWFFVVFLISAVALILGAVPTTGWADDEADCWFNIELNATDLDVGVRGFFDYDPWNALTITDPDSDEIADVAASNSLADQGFAEWFFESGEPTLDELLFAEFLSRFPETDEDEGDFYTFAAAPNEGGDDVVCEAEFTHVIPCEPEISVSGNRGLGVTISWDPVEQIVDTAATDDNVENEVEEPLVCVDSEDLEIVGYEVIVETEVNEEEKEYKIDLPGDATSVLVPPEFIALSDEFEYEVIAIEDSGNQTISEDEFCVNDRNGHVIECPEDD